MLSEQNKNIEQIDFLKIAIELHPKIEYYYDKITISDYLNPNLQINWIINQYYDKSDVDKLVNYLLNK